MVAILLQFLVFGCLGVFGREVAKQILCVRTCLGVIELRDDLVEPAMGKELGAKFLPLLMFMFFFIAAQNLMGLTPMSVTPTASIYVTTALALITFSIMM